jgi:hypothetical protein
MGVMRLRALLVAGAIVVGGCAGDGRDSRIQLRSSRNGGITIVPVDNPRPAPAPAALAPTTEAAARPTVSALPDTTAGVSVAPAPTEVATATTGADAAETTARDHRAAPEPPLTDAPHRAGTAPDAACRATCAHHHDDDRGERRRRRQCGGVGNAGTLGPDGDPEARHLRRAAVRRRAPHARPWSRTLARHCATGQSGNVVIAGTPHEPRRHLPEHPQSRRRRSDRVPEQQRRFVYVVTGRRSSTPTPCGSSVRGGGRGATLFACHPPGSVAQRIVVFAELSA